MRISLKVLLFVFTWIAITLGLLAMVTPNGFAADAMQLSFFLTAAISVVGLIGALTAPIASRPFWIGFAVACIPVTVWALLSQIDVVRFDTFTTRMVAETWLRCIEGPKPESVDIGQPDIPLIIWNNRRKEIQKVLLNCAAPILGLMGGIVGTRFSTLGTSPPKSSQTSHAT